MPTTNAVANPENPRRRLITDLLAVLPSVTVRQSECLRFIYVFFLERQAYPTHREISAALSLPGRQTAVPHIEALIKKKCLERTSSRARNIRITQTGLDVLERDGINVDPARNKDQAKLSLVIPVDNEKN